MLNMAKRKEAKLLAALAAGVLVLTPAFATTANSKKRPAAVSLSFDPISSFTPANADPKLAAALAGKGLALTDFKFTPAPAKGRPSQVRVAIRARATGPLQAQLADSNTPTTAINALAPTSYNLGVALGWKRFAISGDVAAVKDATVKITNPATGYSREVKTGGEGAYSAPSLDIGLYDIEVSAPGFKTEKREAVKLNVGDKLGIDVVLQAGQVSDVVTVTGEAPLVQTESSDRGSVVSGRGTASVWFDERKKQTFEWGEGSFFVLPTNMNFQFFNMSGSEPAPSFCSNTLPVSTRRPQPRSFNARNTSGSRCRFSAAAR